MSMLTKPKNRANLLAVAKKNEKADLVFKNAAVINVFTQEVLTGDVAIKDGYIAAVGASYSGKEEIDATGMFLSPGLIDAHTHIESQLTMPASFVRAVLPTGTTTIISDPHEIVNVAGARGMRMILEASENVPCNYYVMLPSCVPSSRYETSGANFTAADMAEFLHHPRVLGLGEMMSYSDAIAGDAEIYDKVAAIPAHKIIDGHAPGVVGDDLQAYLAATDARTDHETSRYEEMLDKIRAGMAILIRESAIASNLRVLVNGMIKANLPNDRFAFCSDDRDINTVWLSGHIILNVRMAVRLGLPPPTAIRMGSYNAARIYHLPDIGAIAPGYRADLMLLRDLNDFEIHSVYKDGRHANQVLAEMPDYKVTDREILHSVKFDPITSSKIALKVGVRSHVIEIIPGQLATRHLVEPVPQLNGFFTPDSVYSKLVVVERHGKNGNVTVAPLKGFGITKAALASTVAHDSHNLVAAGDSDAAIIRAIARAKELNGGIVLATADRVVGEIQLQVGGIISTERAFSLNRLLAKICEYAQQEAGVPLNVNPVMTLSFLALAVIPELRLTDHGLFDVKARKIIEV